MGTKVLAGRYELFERIGEGGMSVVYKAKDKLLNRFVAIKILKPEFIHDTKFIDSFRRESQAAASLSHPNIVNIYDVGREGNIHYIVMELIEGRTLSDYIKSKGAMSYPKVITLAKQIAAALAFAHKNHIIHRDVKPHNVMITPNGTAKITDFGIAKAVNSATIVDNTEGIIGSVHYFSPEQARGGYVDEKSDIYSLGIVMYEMLTGRVPFDGDNPVNIALMHINGEIVPPSKLVPGVPPALEHIILKCTDKYPVNRYASADELIEALNNLEFVGSVVGKSAIMGKNGRPIAETDYNEGADGDEYEYDEENEPKKNRKSLGSRNKKKKLIIIIAAALAAIALGLAVGFATGLLGGKIISAPTFEGMTVEEAEVAAAGYDLKIKVGDEVISEDVEKGCIVSQDPEAGSDVKTGSTITVNVSKGLGDGAVPDLVGKNEDDLKSYLEAAGFKLGNVTHKASEKPKGYVLNQSPKAGEETEKGSEIDVVVSDGSKAKVAVPSLVGKSESSARSALSRAGLRCGGVTYEYSNSYGAGTVMWQQYDANSELTKGSSVRIKVSKGPEQTSPPTQNPNQGDDEDDDDD
ncbi:MAG: Stk1 family PASTA domain-containing Ser/Thr kinase [Bacillota bacterium]|nr:Stk1 family PASTA domain-containing Ser/Thr kinase [Bacillota bacterium]